MSAAAGSDGRVNMPWMFTWASPGEKKGWSAPVEHWRWDFQHPLGARVSLCPPVYDTKGGREQPPRDLAHTRPWVSPQCFFVCLTWLVLNLLWADQDGNGFKQQRWNNHRACPLIQGPFPCCAQRQPRLGLLFGGQQSAIKATIYLVFSQRVAIYLLFKGHGTDWTLSGFWQAQRQGCSCSGLSISCWRFTSGFLSHEAELGWGKG